jgi:ketosteroid isomerase-like protein
MKALEDAEAIRNLKARYAALCDNQYDADGIAMLFTEDALWESPGLGRFEGREAIRDFFRGASGIFTFAIHYSLNGHIEVEGIRRERGGTCSCLARWPPEIRRCGAPASITRLTRGWMELGCSATSGRSR